MTLTRVALWLSGATATLMLDIATKLAARGDIVHNHARTPLVLFAAAALLLIWVGLTQSYPIALGSGLMFGALAGNAGEMVLRGYATDWIPVGGWLTNVADLAAACGLILCCLAYSTRLALGR